MNEPKLYIGAKLIRACPEERAGVAGYSVLYPDGYRSWSPKDTFESAYREVTPSEKAACVQETRSDGALAGSVDTSVWENSRKAMSEP